ncbi:MAG: hypothetical protein H6Q70_1609 [Firmicutes bacterium]|nr:hypothetical protein [Bacillota bacterium]
MQDIDRAEIAEVVNFTIDECMSNWTIWGAVIILAFVLIMGSTFSFWLGMLVGLAIPYYVIPHYFCEEGDG